MKVATGEKHLGHSLPQHKKMGYPPDHPLWQDVNFVPAWVLNGKTGQSVRCHYDVLPQAALQGTLPADLQQLIASPEDLLLVYLHSPVAQGDNVDAFDVGMVLKTTPSALQQLYTTKHAPHIDAASEEHRQLVIQRGRALASALGLIPEARVPRQERPSRTNSDSPEGSGSQEQAPQPVWQSKRVRKTRIPTDQLYYDE